MAPAGDIDRLYSLLTIVPPPSQETIQTLLTIAVQNTNLDIITLLLTQYPSIPLTEDTVRSAMNTGSICVFSPLLTHDASIVTMPFEKRGNPLTVACMGRQSPAYLSFLLSAGADPNQDPECTDYPLALVAALYHDPDVIDLLLQHGARLEGSRTMGAAASLGNEGMLRRLLGRGARMEVDAAGLSGGVSSLCMAVRKERIAVVRLLMEWGKDPWASGSEREYGGGGCGGDGRKDRDVGEIMGLLKGQEGGR